MTDRIPIAHLNKAALLAARYNNAKPQGMGFLHYTPDQMTEAQAQKLLDDGETRFDYLKGRVMKIDLGKDTLWTALYNRDNGYGAAEAVIAELEKQA